MEILTFKLDNPKDRSFLLELLGQPQRLRTVNVWRFQGEQIVSDVSEVDAFFVEVDSTIRTSEILRQDFSLTHIEIVPKKLTEGVIRRIKKFITDTNNYIEVFTKISKKIYFSVWHEELDGNDSITCSTPRCSSPVLLPPNLSQSPIKTPPRISRISIDSDASFDLDTSLPLGASSLYSPRFSATEYMPENYKEYWTQEKLNVFISGSIYTAYIIFTDITSFKVDNLKLPLIEGERGTQFKEITKDNILVVSTYKSIRALSYKREIKVSIMNKKIEVIKNCSSDPTSDDETEFV